MTGFRFLLVAQFISAFVDNMILFVAQAMILRDDFPSWYLQLVQATFLFAFIILSPWVGRLADRFAKRMILLLGNSVKCAGVMLLMLGLDPALSYAVVGVGAVIYSPAKYGILPWLAKTDHQLLYANSRMESFTIMAILAGASAGGWLAGHSIFMAMGICIGLYLLSALLCLGIPSNSGNVRVGFTGAVRKFIQDFRTVLVVPSGRFSLLGTSGFWMAAAVLRLSVFTWLPLAYGIKDTATIGLMITLSGVGLMLGAVLTPRIIPVGNVSRVIGFGALMGISLMILPQMPFLSLALLVQTACGCFGGLYVIPLNATLQRVGDQTVGPGKIVAIQNLATNGSMFIGVLLLLASSWMEVPVVWAMTTNGIVFLLIVGGLFLFQRVK